MNACHVPSRNTIDHHPLENFQLEKNAKVDSPENDLPVIELTLSESWKEKYSHDYFADKESKREVSHVSESSPAKGNESKILANRVTQLLLRR
jgi:hypothetical protein